MITKDNFINIYVAKCTTLVSKMITKDDFINSDFYNALQKLKQAIEENKGKEPSNKENSQAFARLTKVVTYIDTFIALVDYDLLTKYDIDKLNSISSHINNCYDNLYELNIHAANNHIDECLSTIKTILPTFTLPKKSIENVFQKYTDAIENNLKAIDFGSVLKASQQIQEIAKEQRIEKINKFFQEIYEGNDEYDSLEKQKNDIYNKITELENKITESSNKQNELNAFSIKVFGEMNEETNERQGGLKQAIETRLQKLSEYKTTQEQVIEALKEEIKGLMPNAASVGLAKSFSDEKKGSGRGILIWNCLFTATIVAIVLFAFNRVQALPDDLNTWQDILRYTILGFPIFLPSVWFASYCAKRRSELSMLKQEYAHKESVANSYSSYKQQIEKLQQKDRLSETLLEKTINIISKNPTHVLTKQHSSDLPIEEITILIKACKGNPEVMMSIIDKLMSINQVKEESKTDQ